MADVGSFLEEEHMAIFEGAGVAIVTPFKENGEISFDKLDELIEEQIAGHTDCIVSMGTTGESATTTEEEHLEVIRFTCERVKGRIPVIAGTGSNCTKTAITLSEEAEGAGADGVLLVSPYYNKATQNGLKAHFTAVANAIKIPAVLYNIPSRTGVNIAPQTIVDLCRDVPQYRRREGGQRELFRHCGDHAVIRWSRGSVFRQRRPDRSALSSGRKRSDLCPFQYCAQNGP